MTAPNNTAQEEQAPPNVYDIQNMINLFAERHDAEMKIKKQNQINIDNLEKILKQLKAIV